MKKILFLLITVVLGYSLSYGQTTGYIRNDTIKLTNAAKNTTLVIESASRGHNWYLKDIGNGRTQFVEATIADVSHLQDSLGKKANLAGGNTFTDNQVFNSDIKIQGVTVGRGHYTTSSNTGNVAFGDSSLAVNTNTGGVGNSGFGYKTLKSSTTGGGNTAIGYRALLANTTASINTAIGYNAGLANTTGIDNTFIGGYAGRYNTTGGGNVYIGVDAGGGVGHSNGTGNVFIGVNAGVAETGSYKFYLTSTKPAPGQVVYNLLKGDFSTGQLNLPVAAYNSTGAYKVLVRNNSTGDVESVNNLPDSAIIAATYVKKADGVVQIATIAQLQAYTGTATTIFVTDTTGSGGLFSLQYNAAIDTNRFNKFAATGKGVGYYWLRKADESNGINVLWNPAVKADANVLTGTHTTDNKAAIQAIIDYYPKKSAHLFFPRTYPYSFGISGPLVIGQNTYIEGETAFFPMQATSDTLKFSPQSAIYAYNNTGAIVSQTTDDYRPQAPVLRNIGIFGTGKTNNANGIDLPRNNAYTGSNVNYRDLGVPVFDNVFIDGFTTGVDLKLTNDAQFRYCHITNTRVGVRNGKNANHFYRCDFFSGRASASTDTAAILKGNGLYVEDCVIEPGSSGMGIFLDSVSNSHFINNHIYNVSKGLIFREGCYENIISGNQFITSGTGLTIASAGKNNTVLDNQFSFYTVAPVSVTSTSQVILNGNTFGEPLNSTHAAISASGSSLLMGNNNLNDYTDANKISASTTTFLTNYQFNNAKIVNTAPSISLYNPGSSSATPSYLSSGVDVGANYFDAYSGSGNRHVAYTTGFTLENHSSSAAGTDVAFYGTAPGSTTPTLAGQIGTQGLRLLFEGRAAGDMLVGNIANAGYFGRLGIGTGGQVLTVVSGMPAWQSQFANNSTTSALSASTLNSTYPSVPTGFRVICESISGGPVIYTKGASGWLSTSATIVP